MYLFKYDLMSVILIIIIRYCRNRHNRSLMRTARGPRSSSRPTVVNTSRRDQELVGVVRAPLYHAIQKQNTPQPYGQRPAVLLFQQREHCHTRDMLNNNGMSKTDFH